MRQADCRDTAILFQIKAHNRLGCIPLPVGQPREDEQAWPLDLAILSTHLEGLAHADATHGPHPAGTEVRLHLCDLESSFYPPTTSFGIRQGFEDKFSRPPDRDF